MLRLFSGATRTILLDLIIAALYWIHHSLFCGFIYLTSRQPGLHSRDLLCCKTLLTLGKVPKERRNTSPCLQMEQSDHESVDLRHTAPCSKYSFSTAPCVLLVLHGLYLSPVLRLWNRSGSVGIAKTFYEKACRMFCRGSSTTAAAFLFKGGSDAMSLP